MPADLRHITRWLRACALLGPAFLLAGCVSSYTFPDVTLQSPLPVESDQHRFGLDVGYHTERRFGYDTFPTTFGQSAISYRHAIGENTDGSFRIICHTVPKYEYSPGKGIWTFAADGRYDYSPLTTLKFIGGLNVFYTPWRKLMGASLFASAGTEHWYAGIRAPALVDLRNDEALFIDVVTPSLIVGAALGDRFRVLPGVEASLYQRWEGEKPFVTLSGGIGFQYQFGPESQKYED